VRRLAGPCARRLYQLLTSAAVRYRGCIGIQRRSDWRYGFESGRVVAYAVESGDESGSTDFGEGERLHLPLEPGTYRLIFTSGDAYCEPETVRVEEGLFFDASITCSII
jgi:hypothetical protein